MQKLTLTTLVIAVALSPAALAQTKSTPSSSTQSADVTAQARFKTADKNSSGMLEGAETDAFKPKMAQFDTNKDGRLSRDEFVAGSKAGHIK